MLANRLASAGYGEEWTCELQLAFYLQSKHAGWEVTEKALADQGAIT